MKKVILLVIIAILAITTVSAYYKGTGYTASRFMYNYPVCNEYYLDHAPFFCPTHSDPMVVVCTYRQMVIHSNVGCVVG